MTRNFTKFYGPSKKLNYLKFKKNESFDQSWAQIYGPDSEIWLKKYKKKLGMKIYIE